MNNYGFVKVAAASPQLKVADVVFNTDEIMLMAKDYAEKGVRAIVFPEMSLVGYTSNDLFNQRVLLEGTLNSLNRIKNELTSLDIIIIVGAPIEVANRLYNAGIVIYKGQILGIVPKTFLPNYNEYYDKRWFSSARELKQQTITLLGQDVPIGTDLIFKTNVFSFALEVCEDLWTAIPPSSIHSLYGAEIIFNLSASNQTAGKDDYRRSLISQQSARCIAGYVYASASNGESTSDIVFSGCSMIAENGSILSQNKEFSLDSEVCIADIDIDSLRNDRLKNKSFSLTEYPFFDNLHYRIVDIDTAINKNSEGYVLDRYINPTPFVPKGDKLAERCNEIFSIQVNGLVKRLQHTRIDKVVLGISGGLDSTLALLVCVAVFDKLKISRENIIGITMPGFGTTGRTYNNALNLMCSLGVTVKEISISDAVVLHFKDIDHDINIHDITYENSQARERTQILMDYSNKVNGLVIGTGDLSELALGWCTYNGDHMSMYAVNSSIPKTLVKTLVLWFAENHSTKETESILKDILDTPVSPELLPPSKDGKISQITEDNVGPYLLHDFFLFNMLRYGFEPKKIYFLAKIAFKEQFDDAFILKWLKTFYWRFFSQQFKRNCIPDGPKVGSINLSPRGDWRMASDASNALWLDQLNTME